MAQGRQRIRPLHGILQQEAFEEVHCVVRHSLPTAFVAPIRLAQFDLRHHLLLLAMEGRVACKEHPHNHAQAPQVTLLRIALAGEHVGADICDGPAGSHHQRRRVPDLGEAEVDELQLCGVVALVKEILELQVPVNDFVTVKEADRMEHLPRCICCVGITVDALFLETVIEFPSVAALREQADIRLRLIDIMETGDVGMVQREVDLNLGRQLLQLRG
mmetsp:Transcript_114737/g.244821  ORF Transcript_114737/g.244821 Transcript_114737/m.244821 type:complete len:217 (+) Transcript_114737:1010-1660(+)